MATPRLSLKVLRARNVGVRRASEAPIEPTDLFVDVQCGDSSFQTDVRRRTTTPEWNYDVVLTPSAETVVFTVVTASSEKHVPLGQATIKLAALEPNVTKQLELVVHSPDDAAGWTSSATDTSEDETPELIVEVLYEPEFAAPQEQQEEGALPTLAPAEPEIGSTPTLPRTLSTTGEDAPAPDATLLPKLKVSASSVSASDSPRASPATTAQAPSGAAPEGLELAGQQSAPDAKPEEPSKPPNYVVVTILEGRDLTAMDGKGPDAVSDPLVKLSCTKNKGQKTKTISKSLHPKWRQRFYFYLTPARQVLDLLVEDNDMLQNDFLGQCSIDLEQWRAHFGNQKGIIWLALEAKKAQGDASVSDISPERNMNYGLGKICVAIEMKYIERSIDSLEQGEEDHVTVVPSSKTTRVASGIPPTSPALASQPSAVSTDGGVPEDLEVPDDDQDNESVQRDTMEEIKKKQEERQKMFEELSNVQFHPGDYQIYVRVIEVRDLKPMDLNGLCDPVVSVECLDQRQHTMVKQKQLSCVFDELLVFNFRHLDVDTIQQGSIKVTVLDADGPSNAALSRSNAISRLCSDTIGFFNVDVPYVYFQKDHELHRKWVALVGAGKNDSDSIMGYLLLSIVVVGPGDKIRIHPPHEDHQQDEAAAKAPTNDANSLVLIPPRVRQSLSYLVVTIYQAQDLPDMDQGVIRQGGIDGYVRVHFAGQDVVETKRVTVKGSGNLTVEFNQELWFPVLLPTMSNNIFVSMWDWDLTADELVGNTTPYNFGSVQKYPNQFTQHWANLYGPPVGYSKEPAARKHMFDHPALASTYRGRIQLSMRIEDGSKSVNDRPHARNLMAALPKVPTKSYILRAAVFFGTEIPRFVSKTSWNRNSKMSLKISVGRHEVKTTRVDNKNGMCHWNQYLDIIEVNLPADIDHVPDVFVHLVRQQLNETRYICYARFKAKDIFLSGEEYPEELKKIPTPEWVSLIEDPAMNDLKDHDFTGNVLMNLRLEPMPKTTETKELAQMWREHSAKNLAYTKYTVFVHVYQAKCLPAADTNGLLDPYVKVTCGGAEDKVKMRLATRDPCFYETLALDVELPQDPVFLPKVSVQVFDWDQWDADDYVGAAKFSLTDFRLLSSSTYNKQRASGEYTPPRPRWYPIAHTTEGDTEGELLLSFELIRKETPGIVIEPPETIRPQMEDRYLEITCLGCRGLQPVGFMPMNTPFVRFEMGEVTKNDGVRFTNPSSKPSGRNPNFLERIIMPVKMPVDALYSPRLNIMVYDQLLGGFYKPLLGSCSVDLSSKMELSNGKPNPLYIDAVGDGFVGNPYVDRPTDYSTFPGTLPKALTASASSARSSSAVVAEEETKEERPDTGAGVAPLSSALSVHLQVDDDDDDDVPPYLRNRAILDGPVEDDLNKPPFETYSLFRGDMLVRKKFFGGVSEPDIRPVGKFKGVIRLLKRPDEPPLFDLDQFLAPKPYLVRVYVLDAMNIQPKDENNKSDPYLRLSLGDGRKRHHLINDRENYRKATLTPKFHKMYEFKAELPGASELRLEVLDYDFFAIPSIPNGTSNGLTSVGSTVGGDDFIGATIIDLEDRWFSSKWQQLGANGDAYEKRKPLELRPLYAPSSSLPQGNVRLWVDILTEPEMALVKPLDISLPPPRKFEVRVIVYKARNVTPGDFTDLTDMFVKCWLQNRDDKAQTTDTHWRARDGKGSFNWRMKFDIELPVDEESEADKGYLHLQLWDKDVLYDDCLADSVVDLSMFLKQAYKANAPVDVFAKKKETRMRGTSKAPPNSAATASNGVPPSSSSSAQLLPEGTVPSSASLDVVSDLKRPLLAGVPSSSNGDIEQSATAVSQSQRPNRPRSPSYNGAPSAPPSTQPKPSTQKHKETAEALVRSVKERFGMGDDPENASWLTFTSRDPSTGDRVRAGELLLSVEILPVAVANMRAAGLGRSEPNNFPYLAEPADRLQLSAMWNPLYVLEAMMGPKYYRAFASGLLCALLVALILFAGPLVNAFVTMIDLIPSPYGFVTFGVLLAVIIVSIMFFMYRCRRAVAAYSSE